MSRDSVVRLKRALHEATNRNVLVVEDDPDDRELLDLELRNCGVSITFAESFAEACRQAKRGIFQMCLLDLRLPDAPDPVELVDEISKVQPNMTLVVLTGGLDDPALRKVLEAKVSMILLKPFTRKLLADVFDR